MANESLKSPGATKTTEPTDLATQNAELQAQLARANQKLASAGVADGMEAEVRERMMAGLPREDAVVVTRRNNAYKEALKIKDPVEQEQAILRAGSLA